MNPLARQIGRLRREAAWLDKTYITPGGYDRLDESNITVGIYQDCLREADRLERLRLQVARTLNPESPEGVDETSGAR